MQNKYRKAVVAVAALTTLTLFSARTSSQVLIDTLRAKQDTSIVQAKPDTAFAKKDITALSTAQPDTTPQAPPQTTTGSPEPKRPKPSISFGADGLLKITEFIRKDGKAMQMPMFASIKSEMTDLGVDPEDYQGLVKVGDSWGLAFRGGKVLRIVERADFLDFVVASKK